MESSLFSFIWKYSKREQLFLLAFTVFTFPFLYITLELPKRIINDAIQAEQDVIPVLGFEFSQTQFLLGLCFAYLAAVTIHGLLKMRLNTMKGVLAERLLRRFRYKLVDRMMRFPRSYFQNTSQGELVSMVTSEAEPMGGLMGDAVAQPAFQAGQMAIIVIFLFAQSFWFGLAGIALIPLQAWLIPMLQRQINLLNKDRIREVRAFAAEIGETAAGITDLRTNGGMRFRLAGFTDRLGRLFTIRFRIYQKKFFMKFLNNFITQLTPFFFYSVGGVLAIRGDITVGALVAALAAYKDLSSPWKELLTYYNQTQDMSLRWQIVTERFAPPGMIDEKLFEGTPQDIPHLRGDIEFRNVTVRNVDGNPVLEDLNLTIPAGARVGFQVSSQAERTALAEVLTREVLPARGSLHIAGHNLCDLHQAVIGARIGYATGRPYLFSGTIEDNLLMSLRARPKDLVEVTRSIKRERTEAERAGNSGDLLHVDWVQPELADLEDRDAINDWWFRLTQAMGVDDIMFRRMMNTVMDPKRHADLVNHVVRLRDEVHERLVEKGLDGVVYRFDPDAFNPAVPLGGNLLFAAPVRQITQSGLALEKTFLAMIVDHGLAEQGIAISQTLVETLHQTFGMDGTNHPLFTALGIEEELYEKLVDIAQRRREQGDQALSEEEFALLMTVPFAFTAEQIGPSFPESFQREILAIRKQHGETLRAQASNLFIAIAPENYLPRLTILENLIYGRISAMAGLQADLVQDVVAEVITEHGLRRAVAENLMDVETTIGGTNLPQIIQERVAFNRAAIKRPDVLVLNQPLTSTTVEQRQETGKRLRDLLPNTAQILIDEVIADPENYDLVVTIQNGRIDGAEHSEIPRDDESASDDLRRKLRVIAANALFSELDPRSQRLLAFAAGWYQAEAGQRIFSQHEPPDAAYLCIEGEASLSWTDGSGGVHHVSTVEPGRLIGDLAIILNEPRQLDLTADKPTKFLRIGKEEFLSVVENDKTILLTLLKTVSGHLSELAEMLRSGQIQLPSEAQTASLDSN